MTENTRWWKRQVPKGAKIFAGLLLAINLFVLAGLVFAIVTPEILQAIIEQIPELGQDELNDLKSALPFQLGLGLLSIFGLFMILFNKAWGFVPYAIPALLSSGVALFAGDLQGVLTSLAGVILMAILLLVGKPQPLPARPGQSSNYTYNTKDNGFAESDQETKMPDDK